VHFFASCYPGICNVCHHFKATVVNLFTTTGRRNGKLSLARRKKQLIFIQKFNLYLTMRDGASLDILSKYLLVIDINLRFSAILYSKFGNENPDEGHIKCSRGPQGGSPPLL